MFSSYCKIVRVLDLVSSAQRFEIQNLVQTDFSSYDLKWRSVLDVDNCLKSLSGGLRYISASEVLEWPSTDAHVHFLCAYKWIADIFSNKIKITNSKY